MKKSSGFTLIEVMTALLVVSVITTTILPVINIVYNERYAIKQQAKSLTILQEEMIDWVTAGELGQQEKQIILDNTSYTIAKHEKGDEVRICIFWEGTNSRKYERCESAKR